VVMLESKSLMRANERQRISISYSPDKNQVLRITCSYSSNLHLSPFCQNIRSDIKTSLESFLFSSDSELDK
jgi:hypothetical protein